MNNIQYSQTVYLFADQFAPKPPMLGHKEDCLTSQTKVDLKKLANTATISAFLYLRGQGYITFQLMDTKKLFVFNSKTVVAKKTEKDSADLSGLEAILYKNIINEGKILNAVLYIMDDCFSPWNEISYMIKKDLASKGILQDEVVKKFLSSVHKFTLVGKDLDQYKNQVPVVKKALFDLEKEGEIGKILQSEVIKAIAMREEKPDSDD